MPVNALYNEKELLSQIANGDEIAFNALFNHYQRKIFSISWKLTGVRSAAEDVVQEVFIKLWVHKENLPEIDNFNAYINRVVSNHIYNMLRKVAHENTFLKETIASRRGDADNCMDTISYRELQNTLHRIITQLPPQQKRVYQLSRDEGLTYEEIAERLHIGKATVKTHMIEALRAIRVHLKNNGVLLTWPVLVFIGLPAAFMQG